MWQILPDVTFLEGLRSGVIFRGAQGAELSLLKLLLNLGGSALLKILALALLFKVH